MFAAPFRFRADTLAVITIFFAFAVDSAIAALFTLMPMLLFDAAAATCFHVCCH